MKAEDIVKALIAKLPFLTDKFSDKTPIDSITSSALVATATIAAGHGRVDGELVTITGAVSPITVDSITRTGATAVVVTDNAHDFTQSAREVARGNVQQVILSGANEAEFNGSFKLLSVTNRKTLVVEVTDSGAITATGSMILENGSSAFGQYNGSFNITVINANVFTYPLQSAIPNAAAGAPILNSGHRISAAVDLQRFIDAYTKQGTDKWWCCVVLGDVTASKGRQNASDSTDQFSDGQHYQQSITQTFGIYLIAPAVNAIAARPQRDEMEDVVPFIMQSVLLTKFDTGFAASTHNRTIFTAHGFFLYNGPQYVHELTFEQDADLLFEDSVGVDVNTALRDLTLTFSTDLGTTTLPALLNLDEEPLP